MAFPPDKTVAAASRPLCLWVVLGVGLFFAVSAACVAMAPGSPEVLGRGQADVDVRVRPEPCMSCAGRWEYAPAESSEPALLRCPIQSVHGVSPGWSG